MSFDSLFDFKGNIFFLKYFILTPPLNVIFYNCTDFIGGLKMRLRKISVVIAIVVIPYFLLSIFHTYPQNKIVSDSVIMSDRHLQRDFSEITFTTPVIDVIAEKIKQNEYSNPTEWGENVTGVITQFHTDEQIMALTFDACGGPYGSGYDQELINFLIEEEIKATLFINYRWIEENLEEFLFLASLDQFQIENHGTAHKPLSTTGNLAWGINGTGTVDEVIEEILINHKKVKQLTGIEMKYFRSGTAYYDEVAVKIAEELGMKVVNYDILGDAGATYSAIQVKQALLKSEPGSIALLHMNQPMSGTAEGVKMAIPELKQRGFQFATLDEGDL